MNELDKKALEEIRKQLPEIHTEYVIMDVFFDGEGACFTMEYSPDFSHYSYMESVALGVFADLGMI